ncbi:MAG: hypothetical protein AAGP08_09650 [Pseudomonadota bacterium]
MSFARRVFWALRQSKYAAETVKVDAPLEALRYAYWSERRPLRLELPTEMLRMPGAFAYHAGHPFFEALAEGDAALRRFYAGFQPRNLNEMYRLAMPDEKGADLAQWEFPWRLYAPRTPPRGEGGLSAKHGVAHYGPCTETKIAQEMRRLTRTVKSIETKGFHPDRYGDIEGQLLTDGTRVCFLIMGGKHRAAALAHLGASHVPVRLRPGRMPLVDTRTPEAWPLVASGDVSARLAVAIAARYLEGQTAFDVL